MKTKLLTTLLISLYIALKIAVFSLAGAGVFVITLFLILRLSITSTFNTFKFLWVRDWGRKFLYGWVIIAIMFGLFNLVSMIQKEQVKVYLLQTQLAQKDGRIEELSASIGKLEDKLERSSHIETPETTKQIARFYIKKYFGDEAAQVERVMTCESGLNNQSTHVNRPGLGIDRGLYQINDKFHKVRFEKMYGVSFEVGAHDFDLASKYAKYLYDNSGLNPWVCSRLVASK